MAHFLKKHEGWRDLTWRRLEGIVVAEWSARWVSRCAVVTGLTTGLVLKDQINYLQYLDCRAYTLDKLNTERQSLGENYDITL